MLPLLRSALALLALLLSARAQAHPFVDIQPIPPTAVNAGDAYNPEFVIYPGDTPVTQVQLDFELTSLTAFGVPAPVMGDGFSFVYDPVGDPLHFSIVGDFSSAPLEAFGAFLVADFAFVAGLPAEKLLLLDSSHIVALQFGVPQIFSEFFSNVGPDNVVAHVVPEPGVTLQLASGALALVALSRRRSAQGVARLRRR